MGFAADLKSEGTKLLTPLTHLEKNGNRNNSSLEYFGFSLNHFYQVYKLSKGKQKHSNDLILSLLLLHFFFLRRNQVSTRAAQLTKRAVVCWGFFYYCRYWCHKAVLPYTITSQSVAMEITDVTISILWLNNRSSRRNRWVEREKTHVQTSLPSAGV